MFYTLPTLQSGIESARPFDPLPISRRTLWAHTVGPIIVTAFAGAAIAMLAFALNSRAFSQVRVEKGEIEVPWEYMELTSDGKAPVITAPWGESHTPVVHHLWRGRDLAFYNPYETAPDASERFLEFQTERAVAGVYGALHLGEHRAPGRSSATALDAVRGRVPDARARVAATALLCLSLIGTAILLQYLLYYGRWTRRDLFRWSALGTLITLGAIIVLLAAAQAAGFTRLWYVGVLVSVGLHRLAQWLPLSTGLLWLICVTFWAGAYLLLQKVFATIEFPREKTMNRFAEEY
jgi:hypothetical protein